MNWLIFIKKSILLFTDKSLSELFYCDSEFYGHLWLNSDRYALESTLTHAVNMGKYVSSSFNLCPEQLYICTAVYYTL